MILLQETAFGGSRMVARGPRSLYVVIVAAFYCFFIGVETPAAAKVAKNSAERSSAKSTNAAEGKATISDVDCPSPLPKTPKIGFKDVYKGVPFKAGEKATYLVTYGGVKAGYGTLEVRKPIKHENVWQRVFHADASTGDWFRMVFVGKWQVNAISRPWDFGVSSFFMEQNEGKMFSSPLMQKKWLEFDHDHCKVHEKVKQAEKAEKNDTFDLAYGANDALAVIFNLRSRTFKIGKKERALVYTSEKNWWLEADPIAFEKVTVGAGTFDTVKLKLQTFIGQELQQKGDVYAWYDVKSPAAPLVQIQGEIKIGSMFIKLDKFEPGR
jgi:hypothetical protein